MNFFRNNLLLIFLGLVFFIPFLGNVHLFDWDEINFAEAAREMIVTGKYSRVLINYQPFWEKPPLFIWMQVFSMKLFGINEFAARFPNALCGIITLLTIHNIGKKLLNNLFGYLWVMLYFASLLPHLYFKSGIMDPWFNLFIFLGINYLLVSNKENKITLSRSMIAGFFIGLAVLTKGPVAIIITFITVLVYFIFNKPELKTLFLRISSFSIVLVFTVILWFGYEYFKNGSWFITEFIKYQYRLFSTEDAGHGGPVYYHLLVLILGCFPASVFMFFGMGKESRKFSIPHFTFYKIMMILLIAVVVIFSIVKTKIVHYSSLAYFPITFFAADYIYLVYTNQKKISKIMISVLISIGTILAVGLSVVPLIFIKKDLFLSYIHDEFAKACINLNVPWSGFEWGIGISFYLWILFICYLFLKNRIRTGLTSLFYLLPLVLLYVQSTILPLIEKHIQGDAIVFYQEKSKEDCYVETLGFKSYAPLFYTSKPPGQKTESIDRDWLLTGTVDKTVYFVTKITNVDQYKDLKEIDRKGGYVFFQRNQTTFTK